MYIHKSNTEERVNRVRPLICALSKITLGLLVYPIDAITKKGEDSALTSQLCIFSQIIIKEKNTKKTQ